MLAGVPAVLAVRIRLKGCCASFFCVVAICCRLASKEHIMRKYRTVWNDFLGRFAWTSSRKRKPVPQRKPRSLQVEPLEQRQMLSVTWTGTAGDGLFGTAGNWSTGVAPISTDDVIFPAGSTVQVAAAAAVNSLEFQDGGTLQGSPSNPLTLTSGVVTIDAGTAIVSATLAGSNGLTVQGGTLQLSGDNAYSGVTSVGSGR